MKNERNATMQLKDVAVLITGGGSGLGAATARAGDNRTIRLVAEKVAA
jgi:NADP-dependent 3-hydroxy acid dehydrogenase YdfG